ncbi:MAG: pseudaminic acid cytidylyltransferase [Bacteroidetes bacterium]|nr:pseudaminic acid cytidylyltransferase [Bacteroidota bacterium]
MDKVGSIAVIPARGGSKRIPRKNIKPFMGAPIISYSIRAAIESKMFGEVMVSTDDVEIANVAKEFGADVPFLRSRKNSDDVAIIADVLSEVLTEFKRLGKEFNYVCCIYATSPFVTSAKLRASYDLLIRENADSVVPVVKFGFPIQRAMRIDNRGNLDYVWPENAKTRSQDLEPMYHDAGQFFWARSEVFLRSMEVGQSKRVPFLLSEVEVQDIDNEVDWELASMKYKLISK